MCSAGQLPKMARKKCSWEEVVIDVLCPLIGQCGRIAWWGHWFTRENKFVTSTTVKTDSNKINQVLPYVSMNNMT